MSYIRFCIFTLISLFAFTVLNPHPVQAADVVGNETQEVSWHGLPITDMGTDGYQLFFTQVGTNYNNSVFNIPTEARSLLLRHLKPCTLYNWSLKSGRNGVWNWVISSRPFITGGECPKNQTGPMTVTSAGPAKILGRASAKASWRAVHGAKFYSVYYGVCGEKMTNSVKVPAEGSAVDIGFLDPASNYCYRVGALVGNKEVWLEQQKLRKADSLGTVSANGQKVLAAVVGNESYEVSWHGLPVNDMGTDGYQVFYKQADTNSDNSVFNIPPEARKMTLNKLKACTTYNWSLKSGRNGVWNWVIRGRQFTTGGICPAPEPASSLTPAAGAANVIGNESATVTWSTVNGAEYYNVYYKGDGDNKYMHAVKVPAKGNTVTINHLGKGKYFYKVAALVNGKEVWGSEQKLK